MEHFDFVLIGGGIVGSSLYYKLAMAHPEAKIVLLEKESAWTLLHTRFAQGAHLHRRLRSNA